MREMIQTERDYVIEVIIVRIVKVHFCVISLFIARAERNICKLSCKELYSGTRARGHPAGSQRAEKRDFRKC